MIRPIAVLGAQDPLADGQQGGVLVAGRGRVPGLTDPVGQAVADVQGVGVLGPRDPLADGQQGRELVARPAAFPAVPDQRARP